MQENRQNQNMNGLPAQADPQFISAVTAAVMQTLQSVDKNANAQHQENGSTPKTIDLLGLMFFVLEKFWIVLLAAVICAGIMGVQASKSVPTYTATAKLYIVNPAGGGISISDLQLGTVLTLDYQEVFKTWEVHEMVREELGLPYSYEQMQSMLTVSNPEDTRLMYISATHFNAQTAADIANAYAKAAKSFIINVMRGEEPSDFSIALVPSVARAVSRTAELIKGFLLGSVLAIGILTLLFVLDERPRTPEHISTYGGIPTLAVLPSVKEVRKNARKRSTAKRKRGNRA